MKLRMVGCNHRRTPLELRQRLAFSSEQAAAALDGLRQRFPATEAVVLSTCNRVELYTADEQPTGPSHDELAGFLAEFHGLHPYDIDEELHRHSDEDVVRHLFAVAAGLDSLVLGEPQILAQVKDAYRLATEHQSAGPLTHAVFQAALRVARRVAAETTIQQKRVSIPSVAVADFARQIFERFDDKQVLVIGAGEMAEETLRYLAEADARRIVVVNRSPERAAALAAAFDGRAAPWDSLDEQLVTADLVVSATAASQPIVTRERFARIEARRFQRPLLVLDLAVPRDFEPAVGDCLGVYLYCVDDLRDTADANRRQRENELPAALRIVDEETESFMAELRHRATGPIIARLREGWQRPMDDELRRLFGKLPQLDDASRAEIERSFERLVNKLLHPPLDALRVETHRGTHHGLLEALQRLFQLRD